MAFRIEGLSPQQFWPLFGLSDTELARRGARRVRADARPGYPCRVSLQDAEVGEEVLLLHYEHQPAPAAHRASGPIYVRRGAARAELAVDELPEVLRERPMSLRAYDARGTLLRADLASGDELRPSIERLLVRDEVAYLHLHNARPGCFACRVDRA